jgi:hypothetical protein
MNLIALIEFTLQGMKFEQESISQVEPSRAKDGIPSFAASVRERFS